MSYSLTLVDGKITRMTVNSATGLLLQNPADLASKFYGPTFCVLSTGTTATDTIFNANAPKCIVLGAWGIMNAAGGASDTVVIDDGTTAITDAVDCSAKSDKAFFNFGTFDDATRTIAAAGSLRVVRASACPADVVIVLALAP